MSVAVVPRPEPRFQDGFGTRHRVTDPSTGEPLQALSFRSALSVVPSFEFALRERTNRLATFRDIHFTRVRGIDRMPTSGAPLMLLADWTPGVRLSELLDRAERREVSWDLGNSCALVRQLLVAVALLHETGTGVVHGAISPERIVITPIGRPILMEHVMGGALEHLRYPSVRSWQELRVAVPDAMVGSRLSHEADLLGVGLVALALVLARPLMDGEFPTRIEALAGGAWTAGVHGQFAPLPVPLRNWLLGCVRLARESRRLTALDSLTEFDAAVEESGVTLASCGGIAVGETRQDWPMLPAMRPMVDVSVAEHRTAAVAPIVVHQPEALAVPPPQTITIPPPASRDGRMWRAIAAAAVIAGIGGSAVAVATFMKKEPSATAAERDRAERAGLTGAGPSLAGLTRGQLEIRTDPPGAQVTVDGLPIGVSPVHVDLAAGDHTVEVKNGFDMVSQNVTVEPGRTVSIALPLASEPIPSSSGSIVVSAPAEVQVYEKGRLLGSSRSGRIVVPAGAHRLELVNGTLGFRTVRDVTVESGKVASVGIELPTISHP